jgi:hypothetical protein
MPSSPRSPSSSDDASWIPCPCCDDYLCTIHGEHVHDCPCPPIEEWEDDPYTPSGLPHAH